MSRRWKPALGAATLAVVCWAQEGAGLRTAKDRYSYALGMDLGNQLRKQAVPVNPDLFRNGLKDALSGARARMTEAEVRASIAELQAEMKQRQSQQSGARSGTETKAGQAPREAIAK